MRSLRPEMRVMQLCHEPRLDRNGPWLIRNVGPLCPLPLPRLIVPSLLSEVARNHLPLGRRIVSSLQQRQGNQASIKNPIATIRDDARAPDQIKP